MYPARLLHAISMSSVYPEYYPHHQRAIHSIINRNNRDMPSYLLLAVGQIHQACPPMRIATKVAAKPVVKTTGAVSPVPRNPIKMLSVVPWNQSNGRLLVPDNPEHPFPYNYRPGCCGHHGTISFRRTILGSRQRRLALRAKPDSSHCSGFHYA